MMRKEKFLEKLAKHLLEQEGHNMKNLLIVFPNKRPILFLKKYLMVHAQQILWMPQMTSIDDFVQQTTGLLFEDPLRIYFDLYAIHKTITPQKEVSPDDFFNWAPILLHDFNDVDHALADAVDLYSFLTDSKALELWNTDGTPLTGLQKNYLDFFRKQKEYYALLKQMLLRKNKGYHGMVYRYLAEHFDVLADGIPHKKFCFAGFNALTAAEQRILDAVKHHRKFEFFADADRFYLTPRHKKTPEAGIFLQALKKKWNLNPLNWEENLLLTDQKKMDVVSVSLSVGQTLYAGEIIKKWLQEGVDPMEIAVVPADESMLMPLLNAIPHLHPLTGKQIKYNVTLGYALSQSPLFFFVNRWLELLKLRSEEQNGRYFVAVLLQMLHSAFAKVLAAEWSDALENRLIDENIVMLPEDLLLHYAVESGFDAPLAHLLFSEMPPSGFPHRLLQLLQQAEHLLHKEDPNTADILWRHQLYLVAEQTKYLDELVAPIKDEVTWRTLQRIFPTLFQRSRISLRGEPLEGIQIMGVLETRSLDFSRLIMLGMNEGILPSVSFNDTLISLDIRRKFGLALPQDSYALYAYHFFRLLQRVDHGLFLFNAEPGNLGGGEKSRFLLQLKDELVPANGNMVYSEKTLETKVNEAPETDAIVIEKDEALFRKLNQLAQQGFSPSAINSLVLCPLQFYFKKIAGIKEETQLETSVEADTFGSVIHKVLYALYRPYIGSVIDTQLLKKELKQLDRYLKEAFLETYKMNDLTRGQNHLMYQIAKFYIQRFVQNEFETLNRTPRKIIALEQEFSRSFAFQNRTIRIKGVIDRIDALPDDNTLRIIDYKTGQVLPRDIKVSKEEDIPVLYQESRYSKALQVLIYTWLCRPQFPAEAVFRPGIISLRNVSNGFMELSLAGHNNTSDLMRLAEETLFHIFQQLFYQEVPFGQQQDEAKCAFCTFKEICNR